MFDSLKEIFVDFEKQFDDDLNEFQDDWIKAIQQINI